MKPLGRKKVKMPGPAKSSGGMGKSKGFRWWWEDMIPPDKRSDRQKVKREIEKETWEDAK